MRGVRDLVLTAFRPRTAPPTTATVLRSILWPLAIMAVIHRSYVLVFNRYITDDFAPVYRAVINFKFGWDIYNEHFDHVDPQNVSRVASAKQLYNFDALKGQSY